jgi:hypothetical protein
MAGAMVGSPKCAPYSCFFESELVRVAMKPLAGIENTCRYAGGEGHFKKTNTRPNNAGNGNGLSDLSPARCSEEAASQGQHRHSALCANGFTASADFQ